MLVLLMTVSENPADIKMNKVSNTCLFDKVRIKRKDINCVDFGINKKYCNHYSLPDEFTITREISLLGSHYDISPKSMYSGDREKVANFYYSFVCSFREDIPILELNIVPTENFDLSVPDELIKIIVSLLVLIVTMMIITLICPCLTEDSLLLGYILGSSRSNNVRYYCE